MAKDNEYKLIMAEMSKMFDLEKVLKKEPELIQKLIEKYPLKKCVYLIRNKNEEEAPQEVEPVEQVEENVENSTEEVIENVENNVDNSVDETKLVASETNILEDSSNFPEDYQPLYKVGEKISISYAYGKIAENIEITNVYYRTDLGKYYYTYTILATNNTESNTQVGDSVTMAEDFLVDHEI